MTNPISFLAALYDFLEPSPNGRDDTIDTAETNPGEFEPVVRRGISDDELRPTPIPVFIEQRRRARWKEQRAEREGWKKGKRRRPGDRKIVEDCLNYVTHQEICELG